MGSNIKHNSNDATATETQAVPLACVVCRERHLKCDGIKPTCSRCIDSKQQCFYVQSRRGHRPSRKRQRSPASNVSSEPNDITVPPISGVEFGNITFMSPVQSHNESYQNISAPQSIPQSYENTLLPMIRQPLGSNQVSDTLGMRTLDGNTQAELHEFYYFFFHEAHPCVLPRGYVSRTPAAIMPESVIAAMSYVGSQYSTKARGDPSHLRRLQEALFSKDAKRDGHMVQAFLILGIVQRAQDENELAAATFSHAANIAVSLGMNRSSFASTNSGDCPVLEEMWRRVWWELYVNDILLAAMRHDTFSYMYSAEADVGLPWEEDQYRTCTVSTSTDYLGIDSDIYSSQVPPEC